jgi:hypothetical protein
MDFSVADAIIFPALTTSIFPVPLFHSWRRLHTGLLAHASADAVGCGKGVEMRWMHRCGHQCGIRKTHIVLILLQPQRDGHCRLMTGVVRFQVVCRRTTSLSFRSCFPIPAHIFRCSYQATRISFLGMRAQAHQDMPSVQATRHRRQNALALSLDVSLAQQAVRAIQDPPIMNFSVQT